MTASRACNYLQNAAATTYKKFLQFYAKRSCKKHLFMHKVEQQGYKSCASLMKLADRYGTDRLENACAKALSYTPNPSLKNISTILKNGQDKVVLTSESARVSNKESLKYGITRGASYYKGGDRS